LHFGYIQIKNNNLIKKMETPILDNYIFKTFRRLEGCKIDSVNYGLFSNKAIDEEFVLSLFPDTAVAFIKKK